MATYAIGDLQGCYKALQCLLEDIAFNPQTDTLWFAGDLINRGPQSLETLRFVYSLGSNAISVLGNHDLHLLAVAHGVRQPSKSDTFDEILAAPDKVTLLEWVQHRTLMHHCPTLNYSMVHAGIAPQWSIQNALHHAAEVEQVLQGSHAHEYFSAMYGNQPALWSDNLSGPSRWRVITNYFTRMRYCTALGELDLTTKGSKPPADISFAPWFSHSNRLAKHDNIIFGHWAALQGITNTPNTFALDTGCVWGGKLTAYRLDDGHYFHCHCPA